MAGMAIAGLSSSLAVAVLLVTWFPSKAFVCGLPAAILLFAVAGIVLLLDRRGIFPR